jgi:hypothetical protein
MLCIAHLPSPQTTPTDKYETLPSYSKHSPHQHFLGMDLYLEAKYKSNNKYIIHVF